MANDNRTLPLLSSPYKGEEQAGGTGCIVHPVTINKNYRLPHGRAQMGLPQRFASPGFRSLDGRGLSLPLRKQGVRVRGFRLPFSD